MKIWDIGGQFQYRQNWINYAKIANVILYVVDASNVIFLLIQLKVRDASSNKKRIIYIT